MIVLLDNDNIAEIIDDKVIRVMIDIFLDKPFILCYNFSTG